jgi:hypothetical protein
VDFRRSLQADELISMFDQRFTTAPMFCSPQVRLYGDDPWGPREEKEVRDVRTGPDVR